MVDGLTVERVLLDTDLGMGEPGTEIDDGFALALAVADAGISLELVTTVNGNTDVDTATRLTMQLLERLGVSVPVARGAMAPLLRAHPRSPEGTEVVLPPGGRPERSRDMARRSSPRRARDGRPR